MTDGEATRANRDPRRTRAHARADRDRDRRGRRLWLAIAGISAAATFWTAFEAMELLRTPKVSDVGADSPVPVAPAPTTTAAPIAAPNPPPPTAGPATTLPAADLWVAPDGTPNGDGSAARPLNSMRAALDRAAPGATIRIRAGRYSDQTWGRIATPGLRIIGDGPDRTVFTGTRRLGGPATRVETGSTTIWRLDGIERGWPDAPPSQRDDWRYIPDQIRADNPAAAAAEQVRAGPSPDDLHNLRQSDRLDLEADEFLYDAAHSVLYLGSDPSGQWVEWSTQQSAFDLAASAAGTSISGVAFEGYAPYHGNALGAIRVFSNDARLENVAIRDTAATALFIGGRNGEAPEPLTGLALDGVEISAPGASGINLGATIDARLDRVTVTGANSAGFDAQDCGQGNHCVLAGLKAVHARGLVLASSTIRDGAANGVWFDLFSDDVTVIGSTVTGNRGSGLFAELSQRVRFASNVVAANGGAGVKVTGSRDVVLERNTLCDNAGHELVVASDRRTADEIPGGVAIPAWHADSHGIPEVRARGNLFVHGDGWTVWARESDDGPASPAWFRGWEANAYVALDGSPTNGERFAIDAAARSIARTGAEWGTLIGGEPAATDASAGLAEVFAAGTPDSGTTPTVRGWPGVALRETSAAALAPRLPAGAADTPTVGAAPTR